MADEGLGVLAFVENALNVRETHYRDKAARLRELAATEPLVHFRKKLIELAEQVETLADTISRHVS
jgi:hypothetical protein